MANQSTSYVPMFGNGSLAVNSQLVGVPMMGQYFPNLAASPFYKGNGQGPPTVPINYMGSTAAGMGANSPLNAASPTQGPVFIAIIALVLGILGLRYVHWRK